MTYKVLSEGLFLFFLFIAANASDCKSQQDPSTLPPPIPKPEVIYKDVRVAPGVCVRIYVPKSVDPNQKLPFVVYIHGGGFVNLSAFLPPYDDYCYWLVRKANVVVVSIEYRRGKDYPIPIPFNDSWAALKWVASHFSGTGPEELINKHVDFSRVFLLGDSAGGTIVHNMAMRVGLEKPKGLKITGITLMFPYFCGSKPIGSAEPVNATLSNGCGKIWLDAGGAALGLDDTRVNPLVDSKLSRLGCQKVLVIIAEKDYFRDRGFYYYKTLSKSGWKGKAEVMEIRGQGHDFQLYYPYSKDAQDMLQHVISFINN
ncbi:hypothetical protein U1Q18_007283 [Sarracenia purpurea var. burkii]